MGLLIKTDGTEKQVDPENGKTYDLKELQTLVGDSKGRSYIELVGLNGGKYMIVDEDGKFKGQPINKRASVLAKTLIVGNIMIIDNKEFGADFDED